MRLRLCHRQGIAGPYELNYARADIKGGMLNLLKALTCAVDFIKIDCRSSLPIYASPEKLRCEPETAIDRPGAPGRCPRAGISLPVSKRMPSGTTNSRVLRPVRAAPEPRAGTHAADGRGIQPRPSRSRPRDGAPSPRKISTAPYRPGLI